MGDTLKSLLEEAIELFESDDECQSVGSDAYIWLKHARETLARHEPEHDDAARMIVASKLRTEIATMKQLRAFDAMRGLLEECLAVIDAPHATGDSAA